MIHSCTRVWRQLLRHNIKDKEKKVKVTESTESIYTSRERFDRMLPYVEYITTCLAYSNTPPPLHCRQLPRIRPPGLWFLSTYNESADDIFHQPSLAVFQKTISNISLVSQKRK